MTAESRDLPYFEKPPVIETVLGVFFRPIRGFNSVWQGLYWKECLQNDFPKFELRPPTEHVVERFDSQTKSFQPEVRWQFSAEPDVPRLWAKSESGEHILQVQRNALLCNWLRRNDYLPFEQRLDKFRARSSQFADFLMRNSLADGPLTPASCTVTYVNHVRLEENERWSAVLARMLRTWRADASDEWLVHLESARIHLSFGFPEEHGRLHVTVVPAQQKDTKDLVLQLELTGRVMYPDEQRESADLSTGLTTAHDWVVRGFAQITTHEMHQKWGRVR